MDRAFRYSRYEVGRGDAGRGDGGVQIDHVVVRPARFTKGPNEMISADANRERLAHIGFDQNYPSVLAHFWYKVCLIWKGERPRAAYVCEDLSSRNAKSLEFSLH